MTNAQAKKILAALRPDVDPDALTRVERRRFGFVIRDDAGGSFCLATGQYQVADAREGSEGS